MIFNYRLKFLREKNNFSQKDIAIKLGISNSRYNHYESEIDIIPIKYLIKICEIYNVSLDYIFCFTNEPLCDNTKIKANIDISAMRLKELRFNKKLTLQKFSDIIGCSYSLVYAYEKGIYPIATKYLYNICKKYKISADYLMGKTDKLIKIKDIKINLI